MALSATAIITGDTVAVRQLVSCLSAHNSVTGRATVSNGPDVPVVQRMVLGAKIRVGGRLGGQNDLYSDTTDGNLMCRCTCVPSLQNSDIVLGSDIGVTQKRILRLREFEGPDPGTRKL